MYNVIEYPDGQITVNVECVTQTHFVERVQSYKDLFRLKSLSDAFYYVNGYYPSVSIPCLFGQQSDRRFSPYESFDLKNICQFINSCNFSQVEVFDPHSDVPEALLNNFVKKSPDNFIFNSITDIISKEEYSNVVLVSPDAGAYKKVYKLAEKWSHDLVAANKSRDRFGNINLTVAGDVKNKICLIVDDIAVGGKTFTVLAEKLLTLGASSVYLYVSHGYFVKGFDELNILKGIYCTDSIKEIKHDLVTQYKGLKCDMYI
jgi:ribose-phosphate pyrophosphokinase